jgi:hypothetical protein
MAPEKYQLIKKNIPLMGSELGTAPLEAEWIHTPFHLVWFVRAGFKKSSPL